MFTVTEATDASMWDAFLTSQPYRPFLQSWTMGDVYARVGQEPVRLQVMEDGMIVGIAFAHLVAAKRGRHLAIPYGPVVSKADALPPLMEALEEAGRKRNCRFLRVSPFWKHDDAMSRWLKNQTRPSPLHLLAEHVWYLPLVTEDPWMEPGRKTSIARSEEDVFAKFRATTRNLIRRAEKDGVTIEASSHPQADIEHFIRLHDETRKRHSFTPYTNGFFRAELDLFFQRGEATLYLAHFQDEVIAASIHIHMGGETSYHHGASTHRFSKVPASYLLQWRAIQDAIKRGDQVYNFWGIAPVRATEEGKLELQTKAHPFAGVTLFKTGFSGNVLELLPCHDKPLSAAYHVTRAIETVRKWKRGF